MRRHGAHREQICLRRRAIRCNRRIRALQFVTTTAICLTASRAILACAGRSARLLAFCFLAWLGSGGFPNVRATTYTWTNDAAGSWGDSANWAPAFTGFPSAVDDVAVFGNAITQARTVSVTGGNFQVGTLIFDTAAAGRDYTVRSQSGGLLTLDVTSNSALISVTSSNLGVHTLSADLVLNDNVVVSNASTALFTISGSLSLGANTITFAGNGSGGTIHSGVISGTGGVTLTGQGVVTLSGANIFTGATLLNAGTLKINSETRLGANPGSFNAAQLQLNGGTLQSTATFAIDDANRGVTLGTNGGTFSPDSATTHTIANVVTGSGALLKSNAGTLILSATNTYAGTTFINAGTLTVANGNAIGNTNAVVLSNASGATFNLATNETIGSLAGGGTTGGNVTLGANTLTTGGDNSSTTYGGVISSTGGGLVKLGTGTFTLTGNNTYSGSTLIGTGGAVNIQHANALGATSGTTTVSNSAALQLQGGITTAAEPLTLNGTGVSSDGALRNISGDNTYAGPITLSNASRINSDAGTLTLDVASGSAIAGTAMDVTFGGAGNITVNDPIATTSGALTKDGNGTLTLAATNSFTGAISINAGVLRPQHTGALGATNSGTTVSGGAALELSGSIAIGGEALTLNGAGISDGGALRNTSGTNSYAGATTLGSASRVNSDAGTLTLSGGITGAGQDLTVGGASNVIISGAIATTTGALNKDGTGTLVLIGTNTYSGATTISNGTLQVGNGGTTGTLGSGALTYNGALVFNRSDSLTFSPVIAGTGTLTQQGTGTLTLTGTNTYSGASTVAAGVLNIQNSSALGSTAAGTAVSNGAALQLQGGIAVGAEGLTLNGTGAGGTGALRNISGDNSWAGAVTLGNAARINSDANTLTLSGGISGAAQNLTVGGSGGVTLSGVLGTTTGTLTKDGTGALLLTADNTFTGGTLISAGTLQVGNGGTSGSLQ